MAGWWGEGGLEEVEGGLGTRVQGVCCLPGRVLNVPDDFS